VRELLLAQPERDIGRFPPNATLWKHATVPQCKRQCPSTCLWTATIARFPTPFVPMHRRKHAGMHGPRHIALTGPVGCESSDRFCMQRALVIQGRVTCLSLNSRTSCSSAAVTISTAHWQGLSRDTGGVEKHHFGVGTGSAMHPLKRVCAQQAQQLLPAA
jgi:hypothetical protein